MLLGLAWHSYYIYLQELAKPTAAVLTRTACTARQQCNVGVLLATSWQPS
jgi:hypothetical protein